LSTFTPSLSRVRHWSCPDRLPSSLLDDEDLFLPQSKEAEDCLIFSQSQSKPRVLASWEEKVLNNRELRKKRPRLHLEKIVIDEPRPVKEFEDSIATSRVEPCNTDPSILDIHSEQSGQAHSSHSYDPFNSPPINPTNDSSRLDLVSADAISETLPLPLKEKSYIEKKQSPFLASSNQNDLDTSSQLANRLSCENTLVILNRHTLDLQNSLECSEQLLPLENSSVASVKTNPPFSPHYIENLEAFCQKTIPGSENVDSFNLTQEVLCPTESYLTLSYSYCSYSLLWLFWVLPILTRLCSTNLDRPELKKKPKLGSHSRPRKSRKVLGIVPRVAKHSWILGFTLLMINPVTAISISDQGDDFGDEILCADGVYRGNIDINNRDETTKMSSLKRYENCSVVEGSISITSALYSASDSVMNYSMPNLTEVTDFVLLFRADEIISLETIFPKLAVIRGHKLVQFYALAIYQMKNMETVGLPSLTHIMNGGVRIEKNPNLCYVNTIKWTKIVVQENDKKSHIEIADNQESNKCLDTCPSKCDKSCWNLEQCQRVLVPCPFGTEYSHQELCYTDSKGEVGRPCSRECVGGCRDRDRAMNNPEMCVACNHTRHYNEQGDSNPFMCREKCPSPFVAYKSWTCITKQECSSRQVSGFTLSNMLADSEEAESFYKVYDGQCVEKCPAGYEPVKMDNIWSCTFCKKDCPVNCDGEIINSRESALKLKSCTHIKGDIVINVISGDITPVLEETLRDIKEISGSLKIERSHSLVSLHFFKSLIKIGGEGSQKSLTIFENDNLQKLFPDEQKIYLGGQKVVFIHYNQKLCMKEITQFLDLSDVDMREEHAVSSVSNGNKIVCSEEKLDLKVITGGPDLLRLEYQNYIQTLEISNQNTDLLNIEALLGYHIYYRELSEEQYENKGVSKYEGMDVCGGSTWNILFEDNPAKFTVFVDLSSEDDASCDEKTEKCLRLTEEGKLIGKFKYNPVVTYIPNCKPYTPYAIYVTTVMEKQLAGKATGAQSNIVYARTNESNPSPVIHVKADSPSPYSLDISWSRPVKPHGVIEQYYVEISYLGTGKNEERDYCEKKKDKPEPPKIEPDPVNPTENDLGTCPICESCGNDDSTDASKTAPDSNKVVGEMAFYNEIINKLFHIQTTTAAVVEDETGMFDVFSKRKRRSVDSAASKNSLNESIEIERKGNHTFVYIQYQRNGPIKPISVENITMKVGDRHPYAKRVFVAVPGNQTSLTVNKLKHYSDYEVRVFACQKEQVGEKNKVYRVCSDESILNTKTTFDKNADTIKPWNDGEEIATQVGNSSEVTFIRWLPPQDPNERIVNYVLAWSKDTSQSKPYVKCISLNEINEINITHKGVQKTMMEYKLVTEGEYYIRLRAVSLFDEGKWTRWQFVKVNSNRSGIILTAVLLFFGALIALMAATGGYVYYKKKKEDPGIWNYSSRNPEYIDTAEVYVVDDWEVKREHIKMLEELGKGSFGLVYRGLFNHPTNGDMPCAIKTVNEKSSYRQRIEFLHEASAMKDFKTEHVIKLIGVVSQGQPALVLMELMENGDLKNFLRSLRPDSENNRYRLPVPTLRQVMQMAIEIADGMAYLSVKKLVHRDLAARNCMVSGDIVVKVGDFGMARDVYETEYYRKEGRGLLPVRWMAPESIKDGKFTSQSDVWSYGVVLWEMATLAEQPYQGFTNDEVMKYVKDGNKMRRPEDCPDILYNLMSECWNNNPNDRPTFLEICQRLLPDANDSFSTGSFYTSPDGREAIINQEAMFQLRREQEEANSMDPATPLTIGHNGNGLSPENGHLPRSGESHPMVNLRPGSRSPTHVQFSNESGSRSSKLSMNGIVGIAQRFRNKSGSTSGEA